MQIFDDPRRLRLSGMAAAGADVQPQLRLLMLAEALAAPPTHRALDLSAETAVLCTAASEAVRRRPGWLYVMSSLPRCPWHCPVICGRRQCCACCGACCPPGGPWSRCSQAQGRRWRCSAQFLPPGCPPTPCPCCAAQPRLQAVSAWPLVPPYMGTARTQPIPHILPPPCACRWPSTLPCVSRLLPKIYCMTGTALCRYCWMGLRYRGWMYAQHFADFIPYRTKLTKSCHWQSRTPYYNISLPSAQYTEYILLTERCCSMDILYETVMPPHR